MCKGGPIRSVVVCPECIFDFQNLLCVGSAAHDVLCCIVGTRVLQWLMIC